MIKIVILLFHVLIIVVKKIYYGPNPKIWNNSDCDYIKHGTPNLEKCQIECNNTLGCTAINYNPNGDDCILRKCADGKKPT